MDTDKIDIENTEDDEEMLDGVEVDDDEDDDTQSESIMKHHSSSMQANGKFPSNHRYPECSSRSLL